MQKVQPYFKILFRVNIVRYFIFNDNNFFYYYYYNLLVWTKYVMFFFISWINLDKLIMIFKHYVKF